MFRKIFLINAGLLVIVLLLSYNLYKIWSKVAVDIKSPPGPVQEMQRPDLSYSAEDVGPDYAPSSRMSYAPIIERDLFRPEREEWQPPPPPEEEETEVKQAAPFPQYPGQPPQPEMKKPDLFGIIIIGESKRYAIMQGWGREEQQERTRKIRLADGQIREVPLPTLPGQLKQDKVTAYRIGDYISEAQLVDIQSDKVVLEKDDGERYEILLREPTKLDIWKLSSGEEETQGYPGMIPGQIPVPQFPGGQPIPMQPGMPVYPYMPAYPVPQPGFVPPGVIPQGRPVAPPSPQAPNLPQPTQRNFPSPPGFPAAGISIPPGQPPYPGPFRR